jgi:hypothetical protein
MNYQTIKKHQREQGFAEMQHLIDTGMAWTMEGAIGRAAMECLESGACYLPKMKRRGCYGNTVPSRDDVKAGTKGSYQNSVRFYTLNAW